jgi:hypothetical protein
MPSLLQVLQTLARVGRLQGVASLMRPVLGSNDSHVAAEATPLPPTEAAAPDRPELPPASEAAAGAAQTAHVLPAAGDQGASEVVAATAPAHAHPCSASVPSALGPGLPLPLGRPLGLGEWEGGPRLGYRNKLLFTWSSRRWEVAAAPPARSAPAATAPTPCPAPDIACVPALQSQALNQGMGSASGTAPDVVVEVPSGRVVDGR